MTNNEDLQSYQILLKEDNVIYESTTSTVTYQFKNIQHGV